MVLKKLREAGKRAYDVAASQLRRITPPLESPPNRLAVPPPHAEPLPPSPSWGRYEPGHFYSPIPNWDTILKREELFAASPRELPGIDLRDDAQLAFADILSRYYPEQPFSASPSPNRRYFFDNPAYSYSDAIVFYGMIRHAQPRRILEVGSGYSSCVALDTNDIFFNGNIGCTFIEPFPEGLLSVLRPGDRERFELISAPVQEVSTSRFRELHENDILFIDSTHVSKIGSDVNYLLLDVLPALNPGVYVHIHDLFYPFEYPKEWIEEGRAWNEAYMVRAFLAHNSAFEIVFWNTYMSQYYRSWFEAHMPLCLRNTGGSLWLRKIK